MFDPGQPVDYPLPITRQHLDPAVVERAAAALRDAYPGTTAHTCGNVARLVLKVALGVEVLTHAQEVALGLAPAPAPFAQAEAELDPDDVDAAEAVAAGDRDATQRATLCAVCTYAAVDNLLDFEDRLPAVTVAAGYAVCANHIRHFDDERAALLCAVVLTLRHDGLL